MTGVGGGGFYWLSRSYTWAYRVQVESTFNDDFGEQGWRFREGSWLDLELV